ncbi:hypothetical protein D3C75_493690 [compost metagenome]
MENTRLLPMVIPAHKIMLRPVGHIGGGHRNILVPGNVHPCGIIHLVVDAVGDGEPGDIPFAVIHYRMDIRRKYGLGVVIHRHRRIGPPQEGLGQTGAVVELAVDFQIRLARIQGKARFAFGAVHAVNLAAPDGGAAVSVLGEPVFHRAEGVGPVMLRPVEFNAPGNPRPCQPNQRWLDDPVIVDEIVVVGFVQSPVDSPAQLRHHGDEQIFVLQINQPVRAVLLIILNPVNHRMGVHLP